MVTLTELRRKAEKATQEGWKFERISWTSSEFSYEINTQEPDRFIAIRERDYGIPMKAKFDADYIESANPKVLIELLDRLEKACECLDAVDCKIGNDRVCELLSAPLGEK